MQSQLTVKTEGMFSETLTGRYLCGFNNGDLLVWGYLIIRLIFFLKMNIIFELIPIKLSSTN